MAASKRAELMVEMVFMFGSCVGWFVGVLKTLNAAEFVLIPVWDFHSRSAIQPGQDLTFGTVTNSLPILLLNAYGFLCRNRNRRSAQNGTQRLDAAPIKHPDTNTVEHEFVATRMNPQAHSSFLGEAFFKRI